MILNFHGVGPIPRALENEERKYWLETQHFEAILRLVVGKPYVRLTFDDGNASDFTHVLPRLISHGLKAGFFVCTGRLGSTTYLSPQQVRGLKENRMDVGSHGVLHRSWRTLPLSELRPEIVDSKVQLEQVIGCRVTSAACPFGDYNHSVLTNLRSAGYDVVYTTDGGETDDAYWLRARTTVTRNTSIGEIDRLIKGSGCSLRQLSINLRRLFKCLR